MKDQVEIVARLINALETARAEMLALYPRLTGDYQRNIKEACDRAKIALADAKKLATALRLP